MPRAYYVVASVNAGTGNARKRLLCGPFERLLAATRMVPAVRRAARRSGDPAYEYAAFGTGDVVYKRDAAPPPGTLDYALLDAWDIIDPYRERHKP